jgi:hypothetical protein
VRPLVCSYCYFENSGAKHPCIVSKSTGGITILKFPHGGNKVETFLPSLWCPKKPANG